MFDLTPYFLEAPIGRTTAQMHVGAWAAMAFYGGERRTRRGPRQRTDGKPRNRSTRRGQIPGTFKRKR